MNLLGTTVDTCWNFSLHDLYLEGSLSLQHLADGFTEHEVHLSVRGMHSTASPGPDGLRPYFLKSCWSTVPPLLSNLLSAFHDHQIELSRKTLLSKASPK
jgi:hypothetical protein